MTSVINCTIPYKPKTNAIETWFSQFKHHLIQKTRKRCNCSRHLFDTFNMDNAQITGNEIIYHKNIHKIYDNIQLFKKHEYCSVKCQSLNLDTCM